MRHIETLASSESFSGCNSKRHGGHEESLPKASFFTIHFRRRSIFSSTITATGTFSPVREYHDICMTFCGITMTRFGAMTRNHDIASQTPPWGP